MISNEILKQSTSNKYYNLGLAQGLAYSCVLASELKTAYSFDEWVNFIRRQYSSRDFFEYFDRFTDEYRRNKQKEEYMDITFCINNKCKLRNKCSRYHTNAILQQKHSYAYFECDKNKEDRFIPKGRSKE